MLSGPTCSRSTDRGSTLSSISRRLGALAETPRHQQANLVLAQPPQHERQRACRRGVDPLAVVHRDDDRTVGCQQLHARANRDSERPRVERLLRGRLHEQCGFERVPPRGRQSREQLLHNPVQEVGEHEVREPTLRLGGSRGKHAKSAFLRRSCDPCRPERRLPDPCFALQHEGAQIVAGAVEETLQVAELGFPANDLASTHFTIVTQRSTSPRTFWSTRP